MSDQFFTPTVRGPRIPPKEPYEGKATQKQKQRLWELGFREKKVIDSLGKKQASSVIDQLYKSIHKERSEQTTKVILVISLALIAISIITILFVRFSGMGSESDISIILVFAGIFVGLPLLILSLIRFAISKAIQQP